MRKWIVGLFLVSLSTTAFAQSADRLWQDLMAGNQLFVEGQVVFGSLRSARAMWATGQNPPVSILSCADSRVPPEILFQRTVGELFVVRTAGNVEDEFNIASLEYAAKVKGWTKLIVVMGHSDCGAVATSLSPPDATKLTVPLYDLVLRIRKSFVGSDNQLKPRTVENVCYTAAQLRSFSDIPKDIPIKTAYYDVATGVVTELHCGATPDPMPYCRFVAK